MQVVVLVHRFQKIQCIVILLIGHIACTGPYGTEGMGSPICFQWKVGAWWR